VAAAIAVTLTDMVTAAEAAVVASTIIVARFIQ